MTEEVWLPVVDHEGLYEVSSLGRIRSLDRYARGVSRAGLEHLRLRRGKILSPAAHSAGYLSIALTKLGARPITQLVHRVVATAFLPNPSELPWINHKDANKHNNAAGNLEWCTATHNYRHAVSLGLHPVLRGSQRGTAKLNEEQVAQIKRLIRAGLTNKELSKMFNVSTAPISYIRSNLAWTHVPW